jgi:TonB family protein
MPARFHPLVRLTPGWLRPAAIAAVTALHGAVLFGLPTGEAPPAGAAPAVEVSIIPEGDPAREIAPVGTLEAVGDAGGAGAVAAVAAPPPAEPMEPVAPPEAPPEAPPPAVMPPTDAPWMPAVTADVPEAVPIVPTARAEPVPAEALAARVPPPDTMPPTAPTDTLQRVAAPPEAAAPVSPEAVAETGTMLIAAREAEPVTNMPPVTAAQELKPAGPVAPMAVLQEPIREPMPRPVQRQRLVEPPQVLQPRRPTPEETRAVERRRASEREKEKERAEERAEERRIAEVRRRAREQRAAEQRAAEQRLTAQRAEAQRRQAALASAASIDRAGSAPGPDRAGPSAARGLPQGGGGARQRVGTVSSGAYAAQVRAILQARANAMGLEDVEGVVGISFSVGPSGRLINHGLTRPSGNHVIDRAIRSMLASVSFPPPPGGSFTGNVTVRVR